MHRLLTVVAGLLLCHGAVEAHGLLIPVEKTVPPLAMLNHQVSVTIEDQVAVTRVEQTFRNSTDRQLEATYLFPVPRGASVNRFTMWVNGKEVGGEMVEAAKARSIYSEIVRRTQDPGLLEYVGTNLLKMQVFPIPPRGDQKVALRFTSVAQREGNVVEYVYPLKTAAKAVSTLEKFSVELTLRAQHPIQTVYSPTHAISVKRSGDREASVVFERDQAVLDKDFQLFYTVGDQDVGVTALADKPLRNENGYVLLTIAPRVELSASQVVPRDVVMVLDTSGSMAGAKMDQARRALKYCLSNLGDKDRFALINFSTTVNKYRDSLQETSKDRIEHAKKWVDELVATGGTAINDALATAMEMRSTDAGRTFTIVFFTDGQPTFGETNPEKILRNVAAKNSANTRIFTFGVGDDVNATMLDQLAEQTRAVSTYVRPAEDIEAKVSGLYAKISQPVLTNLKVAVSGGDIALSEIYPPHLPDLFHGGQLILLARYSGNGPAAITLTGQVGMDTKQFVYEMTFPEHTDVNRDFVEHLWARRKVGYLLDEVRANGEKKELIDEVVTLAKKYGIATPYTSYLIVPDGSLSPTPYGAHRGVAVKGDPTSKKTIDELHTAQTPPALTSPSPGAAPRPVREFAKDAQDKEKGGLAGNRDRLEDTRFRLGADPRSGGKNDDGKKSLTEAAEKKEVLVRARSSLAQRRLQDVQSGKLGVDLSIQSNNLRNQVRLEQTARRNVAGRNCLEVGGVWIDEDYNDKMPTMVVKAQSDAYFRLLERQPQLKDVLQLGNHLLWVTPNGTALVIDTSEGKDKLTDNEIDTLFAVKKSTN